MGNILQWPHLHMAAFPLLFRHDGHPHLPLLALVREGLDCVLEHQVTLLVEAHKVACDDAPVDNLHLWQTHRVNM